MDSLPWMDVKFLKLESMYAIMPWLFQICYFFSSALSESRFMFTSGPSCYNSFFKIFILSVCWLYPFLLHILLVFFLLSSYADLSLCSIHQFVDRIFSVVLECAFLFNIVSVTVDSFFFLANIFWFILSRLVVRLVCSFIFRLFFLLGSCTFHSL